MNQMNTESLLNDALPEYVEQVLSNAGTSEGVRKAWETRKRGGAAFAEPKSQFQRATFKAQTKQVDDNYNKDQEEYDKFPDKVEHEGKKYHATGKKGKSGSGEHAMEYEDDKGSRVWRRASGSIKAD